MKNAETYQQIVNRIFKNQLGRIMEGYVDDMFVKSMTFKQHRLDFKKVFNVLSQYQIKLNPFKYVFAIKGEIGCSQKIHCSFEGAYSVVL